MNLTVGAGLGVIREIVLAAGIIVAFVVLFGSMSHAGILQAAVLSEGSIVGFQLFFGLQVIGPEVLVLQYTPAGSVSTSFFRTAGWSLRGSGKSRGFQ